MSIELIRNVLIKKLKECRVVTVTLTGGEPFLHPQIIEIVRLLRKANIRVAICTNGTVISQNQMRALSKIGNVYINVSLDGFKPESHGKFRGDKNSFAKTIKTIRLLRYYHLLQGILVTINNLAEIEEYRAICKFAIQNKAIYVHMNPICKMGRGIEAEKKLGVSDNALREIKEITLPFSNDIQLVYVRFPNDQKLPLNSCEAGNIIHVFVDGKVAICPYLFSAAQTPQSLYKEEEFIVGNIFRDTDIATKLDLYEFQKRYRLGDNPKCKNCHFSSHCGKGCPAMIIISGKRIDKNVDPLCPMIISSKKY